MDSSSRPEGTSNLGLYWSTVLATGSSGRSHHSLTFQLDSGLLDSADSTSPGSLWIQGPPSCLLVKSCNSFKHHHTFLSTESDWFGQVLSRSGSDRVLHACLLQPWLGLMKAQKEEVESSVATLTEPCARPSFSCAAQGLLGPFNISHHLATPSSPGSVLL